MQENYLLINIDWSENKDEELTLNKAAAYLDVTVESIDKEFGIINVDMENNIYTLQLRETEWNQLNKNNKDISGPFSNPKIEPFGLE